MSHSYGDGPAAAPAAAESPRPTRAELRRAAEAQAESTPASRPGAAPVSRLEQRRLAEQQVKQARKGRALWKAWWVYPLAAATLVFVYLGVQAASNAPNREPSVVTTIPQAP